MGVAFRVLIRRPRLAGRERLFLEKKIRLLLLELLLIQNVAHNRAPADSDCAVTSRQKKRTPSPSKEDARPSKFSDGGERGTRLEAYKNGQEGRWGMVVWEKNDGVQR